MLSERDIPAMAALFSVAPRSNEPQWAAAAVAAMHDVYNSCLWELQAFAHDEAAMAAVAARSFVHSNGFAKVTLARDGDPWLPGSAPARGWQLRLHVWPASGEMRDPGNPHAHRWPFVSVPIAGALTELRLAVVPPGLGTWPAPGADWLVYRHFSAHGTPLTNRESAGESAGLAVRHLLERRPGMPYGCRQDEVHVLGPAEFTDHPDGRGSVFPPRLQAAGGEFPLCATLVLTGTPEGDNAPIYRRTPMAEGEMVLETPPLSPQAAVALVDAARAGAAEGGGRWQTSSTSPL